MGKRKTADSAVQKAAAGGTQLLSAVPKSRHSRAAAAVPSRVLGSGVWHEGGEGGSLGSGAPAGP